MREKTFKNRLLTQARLKSNHSVLDIGCGTGTLIMMISRDHAVTLVTGVDGDTETLRIAARKTPSDKYLVSALAHALPYRDASFDIVLSSLFFHHLTRAQKQAALGEVYRVLKPGGHFHVVDWGKPSNVLMRLVFFIVQIVDGFETTRDNVNGVLPHLIADSGFSCVGINSHLQTVFGTFSFHDAVKLRR